MNCSSQVGADPVLPEFCINCQPVDLLPGRETFLGPDKRTLRSFPGSSLAGNEQVPWFSLVTCHPAPAMPIPAMFAWQSGQLPSLCKRFSTTSKPTRRISSWPQPGQEVLVSSATFPR